MRFFGSFNEWMVGIAYVTFKKVDERIVRFQYSILKLSFLLKDVEKHLSCLFLFRFFLLLLINTFIGEIFSITHLQLITLPRVATNSLAKGSMKESSGFFFREFVLFFLV